MFTFRFFKSISLTKHSRLNLSKKGIGYSWGGRLFRLTFSPDGRRTLRIKTPIKGLFYQKTKQKRK